jgi:3-vinyl bacteriochlorophyllide hydratase
VPSRKANTSRQPLYSAAERRRRDASRWTLVQGILAPAQFVVFLISLALVLHLLVSGTGATAATVSIIAKTVFLAAIMITGCLWERDVFGCYLFAKPFFWEDVVSMAVIALHLAYLAALLSGLVGIRYQMYIALAAYAAYVTNATQFLLKLRAARREWRAPSGGRGTVLVAVK